MAILTTTAANILLKEFVPSVRHGTKKARAVDLLLGYGDYFVEYDIGTNTIFHF